MSDPKGWVLITGASSGIGADFARLFAKEGWNLVLVARSQDKLEAAKEELETNYKILVKVIVKDLSVEPSAREIYQEVSHENIFVEALVNNAGFAQHGEFRDSSMDRNRDMMQLNMATLTDLTRLFLPAMLENKKGKILNVASTAAFQPGPLMAVYYATKAYVLFLSEALREELSGTGVSVTCLCPGPTQTGFQDAAAMEGVRAFNLLTMNSKRVSNLGFEGMMKGKALVVPGFINKLLVFSVRLSPRFLTPKVVKFIMGKVRH